MGTTVRKRSERERQAVDLILIARELGARADWWEACEEETTARLLRSAAVKLEYLAAKVLERKRLTNWKEKA